MTGEDCSHFAIVIDQRYVFHSNFYGTNLQWRATFELGCEVVHRLDIPLSKEVEENLYQRLLRCDGRPYDWGAFFYLAFALLKYRIFKYPVPRTNPWSSNKNLMCVELASCLNVIGVRLPDLDTVFPERLYYLIKEQVIR